MTAPINPLRDFVFVRQASGYLNGTLSEENHATFVACLEASPVARDAVGGMKSAADEWRRIGDILRDASAAASRKAQFNKLRNDPAALITACKAADVMMRARAHATANPLCAHEAADALHGWLGKNADYCMAQATLRDLLGLALVDLPVRGANEDADANAPVINESEDRMNERTVATLDETIARIKMEIMDDVRSGIVPSTAGSFGELHNYVDANCYGGFFDDKLSDALIDHFGGRDENEGMPDGMMKYLNDAQDAISTWISEGGIEYELARECAPGANLRHV